MYTKQPVSSTIPVTWHYEKPPETNPLARIRLYQIGKARFTNSTHKHPTFPRDKSQTILKNLNSSSKNKPTNLYVFHFKPNDITLVFVMFNRYHIVKVIDPIQACCVYLWHFTNFRSLLQYSCIVCKRWNCSTFRDQNRNHFSTNSCSTPINSFLS